MPHTYRFADAAHSIVERDDGASFTWPKHENIANVGNAGAPGGRLARIVEQFRLAHLARARGLLSLYRGFFETKPWSRASSFSAADRVSFALGRY
jgi:hypothetical protein